MFEYEDNVIFNKPGWTQITQQGGRVDIFVGSHHSADLSATRVAVLQSRHECALSQVRTHPENSSQTAKLHPRPAASSFICVRIVGFLVTCRAKTFKQSSHQAMRTICPSLGLGSPTPTSMLPSQLTQFDQPHRAFFFACAYCLCSTQQSIDTDSQII